MKRTDNVVWACRPIGKYPNAYVKCDGEKNIKLEVFLLAGTPGIGIVITRDLARLLAKRINQCLMDTQ